MKNLRVGFSTSRTFWSSFIRWWSRGHVSHVFLLAEIDGRRVVVGGDWNGFMMQSYKRFRRDNYIVAVPHLVQSIDNASGYFLDRLDDPYDWVGFIGMGLVELGRRTGRKFRNPWGSGSRAFCSKALVQALQSVNYPGTEGLVPGETSPQVLLDHMLKVAGDATEVWVD